MAGFSTVNSRSYSASSLNSDSDHSISFQTDSAHLKYTYVTKEDLKQKNKTDHGTNSSLKNKKDDSKNFNSAKRENLRNPVIEITLDSTPRNRLTSGANSEEADSYFGNTQRINCDTNAEEEKEEVQQSSKTTSGKDKNKEGEKGNIESAHKESESKKRSQEQISQTSQTDDKRKVLSRKQNNTEYRVRLLKKSSSEDLTPKQENTVIKSVESNQENEVKQNHNKKEEIGKKKLKTLETSDKTTNTERLKLKYPPMAEFSVVIKKKQEDSDYSDLDSNHIVFYNDDSETNHRQGRTKTKKKKKKSTRPIKSPKKVTVVNPDLPTCPVCHQSLDERTKRVYSKPIATEVYFPFLDQDDIEPTSGGRIPKVKICYPCYENLIIQWKEYNKAGVSHSKRKYRDLNGKRIKTKRELELEEQKREKIDAINSQLESASEYENNEQSEEKEQSTRRKALTPRTPLEEGLLRQEDMNDLLAQIHSHIEMVEFNSTANLERTKLEIEHTIRKHSNRMKDDIQGLKVENEIVRKQVVRMRRELAEMRTEVQRDVKTVKKRVLKQEKNAKKEKEKEKEKSDDNTANIEKSQTPKPFY